MNKPITKSPESFLEEHRLSPLFTDMEKLVSDFTDEMTAGLEGKESSLCMIPTYIEAENNFLTDVYALAIDAGGTNFRSALVRFNRNGKIETGEILNYLMPGIEKEISADEFFETMASYIKSMAQATERIGFCFSYPTEIMPDRDGRLILLTKQIMAPGLVGRLIGKSLLEKLGTPGKQLVLLNDTVSTLLAGKSGSITRSFDSFIGFILGTGTNTAYIEKNGNISKNKDLHPGKSQIINIESGNFSRAPGTDLDLAFDSTTNDPGSYSFEKMISGRYFGGLCHTVLKAAGDEGVFSPRAARKISGLPGLTTNDVNDFMVAGRKGNTILMNCFNNESESGAASRIIATLIERAAMLVAGNLAAVVLKTGKGRSPERPVLITVEGSVFYKLHNLKSLFEDYFNEFLSGERQRYCEFIEVQQSSLIGAALAALIDE